MVRLRNHRVSDEPPSTSIEGWSRRKQLAVLAAGALVAYAAAVYIIVPRLWKRYAYRHPALEEIPNITYAADGIPGDPLNVALIGTKAELIKIMLAGGWHPADALSLRSC